MNLDNKALSFASKLAKYCINVSGDMILRNEKCIAMAFPIKDNVAIIFTINEPLTVAQISINGAAISFLPMPILEYNKSFNISKYVESCYIRLQEYPKHYKYTQIGDALSSWLKVYKKGYTFSNFKEAVYNNIACDYSYSLSSNIETNCDFIDKLIINTNFHYVKGDKNITLFLNFPNQAVGYNGINIIDLKPDFFYRKCDIDSLLTTFAHLVPEVAIYFRNKNIATLLKGIK